MTGAVIEARDGPQMPSAPLITATPVSRLIPTPKPQAVTGNKRARKPGSTRTAKPPQPSGYFWRKDGAGWELRKSIFVTGNNGEKKRKQPYVAHLSREAFQEMKRNHRGAALEKAISQWIEEHDR
jgi:hypothetical protein